MLFVVLLGISFSSVNNVYCYDRLLYIGALTRGSTTNKNTSSVQHQTDWGQYVGVDVVWSFVDINNCFSVLQEAKRLTAVTDLLIFDDELSICLGHGLKQNYFQRPILYYKDRHSVYVNSKAPRPAISGYLFCEFPEENVDLADTENCHVDLDAEVNMEPSVTISRADTLFSIVKQMDWKNIIVFHEESSAKETMALTDLLSSISIDISLYDLDYFNNVTEIQQLFTDNCILQKRTSQFLVIGSIETVKWIMSVADSLDKIRKRKVASFSMITEWLIILPDDNKSIIESCVTDLDNVAVVVYPPAKYIFIHDMMKGLPIAIKEILNKVGTFNFTESVDFSVLQNETTNLFIKYFTHHLKCWKSDIYTLLWKPNGRQLNHVGYVNITSSLNLYHKLFPNKEYGFNQRLFTISTLPYYPFVIFNASTQLKDSLTYPYRGYCMDILTELSIVLNFSFTISQPPDGEWGILVNNSWTGAVGQLQREEVDLVVGPLTIINDREYVMDFTYPFYHDFLSVLFKRPDPSLTKWRTMIDPFRWEVLMCIGFALVGSSIILFLLEKWNPFYAREPYLMRYSGTHVFQDAFWYMFGAMLTQGGEHLPDSQAGRTMISTWWLFSIIMAATYSGNLIAFLTVTKDTAPFETFSDLVDQDDYSWGLLGGGYYQMEFENSRDPLFREIWDDILGRLPYDRSIIDSNQTTHLQKVHQRDYAFIADRGSLETHVINDCDLYLLKEKYFSINYGFGLQNQSGYNDIFSMQMLNIYENGLLQIWQRQWWNEKKFCKGPLQTNAKPIDLVDVQSSFYLIGVGIFLAAVSLGVERLLQRFFRNKKIPVTVASSTNDNKRSVHAVTNENGQVREDSNRHDVQDANDNNNCVACSRDSIFTFNTEFTSH